MPDAKVRSLYARPVQSADLSFEVAGILGWQNQQATRLGTRVRAFDLAPVVKAIRAEHGKPAPLEYTPSRIKSALGANALFTLRNDLLEATLSQSLAQRQIALLERYMHRDKILADLAEVYPDDPDDEEGRVRRLLLLSEYVRAQRREIRDAYLSMDQNRVLTDTVTTTRNMGDSSTDTRVTPVSMRSERVVTRVSGAGGNSTHETDPTDVRPHEYDGQKWIVLEKKGPAFLSQNAVSANNLTNVSTTRNPDFRHPFYDNLIQEQRAQLDLQEELLAQRSFAHRIPYMGRILDGELESIDLELCKAQLRFMQSFLVSPITGVVTAVYKDIGEAVNPGEPVVRIDNDESLLLVGILQCRAPIRVNPDPAVKNVAITTTLFEAAAAPLVLEGRVASVRGHDADDDEWDLIIEIANSDRLVPINYHFDRDNTSVVIS